LERKSGHDGTVFASRASIQEPEIEVKLIIDGIIIITTTTIVLATITMISSSPHGLQELVGHHKCSTTPSISLTLLYVKD